MKKSQTPEEKINPGQVKNLFRFIDASQSEPVKESMFGQLGRECFHAQKMEAWIESFRGDVQALVDRVNVQQASKYWERLEFSEDRKTLILTGRKVQGCACVFAVCAQPPQSLCKYCCRGFHEEFFGILLGRKVGVDITESFLWGDERCSATIHLAEE